MKPRFFNLVKTDKNIKIEQKKADFYCIIVKNNVD